MSPIAFGILCFSSLFTVIDPVSTAPIFVATTRGTETHARKKTLLRACFAALVALAFKTHRGTHNAVLRALGVAAATLLGMLGASALSVSFLVRAEPWLTAIVSGLLLHIVTHGWAAEGKPTFGSRVMDFVAIAAGVGLVAFGGHSHAGDHGHAHDAAHGEHSLRAVMGEALLEVFKPLLRRQMPEIVDAWLPPEACSYRIAVVSIAKKYAGQARRVMMGLWSMLPQFSMTKLVIVVDDDVDIRSWADVMWAVATRMDPSTDLTTIDRGESRPMRSMAFLKSSRSSAFCMVATLAPRSSTP